MNRTAAIILLSLLSAATRAQLVEFPLPRTALTKSGKQVARTQTVDPTVLPFFDDFSSSDTLLRDTLWLYGQSVSLNNGIGIRPPSRNVVTLDGTDSLGKPYNINDVLAKGFADKLTSQPIRMDLVAPGDRPTVYFSFFYQLQGRGEPPDPGDQLILAFKAQDGTWENVHVLETNSTMPTDIFQQVILPVADDRFFHDAFQFRFVNYARLSGPYDTWNVDYVYLNKGRSSSDIRYPDRTISGSFTSLFPEYFALPIDHFLEDISGNIVKPTLELYNMLEFDVSTGVPHTQPIFYTTEAIITSRVSGSLSNSVVALDADHYPGSDLPGLDYMTVALNTLPAAGDFDPGSDSIHIRLKFGMLTKDNVPLGPPDNGDYNPLLYDPIDFRYSDSLTTDFTLSSYYAYDDGTAEYGAGLNQAGSYLAFQFVSRIDSADTITYVDIYFPEFGDNTNQSLVLQVRSILGDINTPPLFEQLIVVSRTTKNKFTRYPLYRPVIVGNPFYVGWKQINNASIPVGLDKNTDNGSRIYYNTTGEWVQNTLVKGSMMVRPGFGKGDGSVITGVEPHPQPPKVYPNPAPGSCRVRDTIDKVDAYDLTGRQIELSWEPAGDETLVTFSPTTQGLVLLRLFKEGRVYTQKIIVQAAGR